MNNPICYQCNQQMTIGRDGKYHHFYLEWNGYCPAKTEEQLLANKNVQKSLESVQSGTIS